MFAYLVGACACTCPCIRHHSQKRTRRSSLVRYRADSARAAFAVAPCFRDSDRCNLVSPSSFGGPHSSLSACSIIRNDGTTGREVRGTWHRNNREKRFCDQAATTTTTPREVSYRINALKKLRRRLRSARIIKLIMAE